MAKDTLPAINKSEASGEIAEVCADIRTTLDVSAIDYVWRHVTIMFGLGFATLLTLVVVSVAFVLFYGVKEA